MKNLKWRSKAKIAAWVHMIIVALPLLLLTILVIIITVAAKWLSDLYKSSWIYNDAAEETANRVVMVFWIIVGIFVIFSALEIWTAVMLLNATKTTTGANDCYWKCRNYIIITSIVVILLVPVIIVIIVVQEKISLGSVVIGTILRLGFIFVACQFRQELSRM